MLSSFSACYTLYRTMSPGKGVSMQKRFCYALYLLLLILMTACASSPVATVIPVPSNTPVPAEKPASIDITLYRGNAQRTGVFDFPAIRSTPSVKWQTEISSTWLMPPIVADSVLYTGSGD